MTTCRHADTRTCRHEDRTDRRAGSLSSGVTVAAMSQVAAGRWHCTALGKSGRVFAWGRNDHGQARTRLPGRVAEAGGGEGGGGGREEEGGGRHGRAFGESSRATIIIIIAPPCRARLALGMRDEK